jgi:hypothetical protein
MPTLRRFRFGDYLQEISIRQNEVSYNVLMPRPQSGADGQPVRLRSPRLRLKPLDVHRLLTPYVSSRFLEQFRAIFPLAIYFCAFQIVVLRQPVSDALSISGGLFAAIVGLMFFLEGLKLGLMPYSEAIGLTLPKRASLQIVMAIAFTLGIAATFAEPAVGALQDAGKGVDVMKAPYLYTLLTDRSHALVAIIAMSMGLSALTGVMRFVFGWSLKPVLLLTLLPNILLTVAAMFHPELHKILGLAWDAGAAVAGPVTIPLVLALGIGVTSAVGRQTGTISGFGIVSLASLFPVSAVLLYGSYVILTVSPESIIEAAHAAARVAASDTVVPWYESSPGQDVIQSLRAILPLVAFLALVLRFVIREKLRNSGIIRYGISLTVIGMILFNVGLSFGLSRLGDQSGGLIPAAFTQHPQIAGSPLYGFAGGIAVVCAFGWLLGFGSTLAEPAVSAMAGTVEDLTSGAFRASILRFALALGVGTGIMIGLLKILLGFPLEWILLPAYLVAGVITLLSSEEMVNLGWDAAGATSGPVTTPLVLAMGLGIANAVGAVEGFGILAVAAIFSVFPVLAVGLWIERRASKAQAVAEAASG